MLPTLYTCLLWLSTSGLWTVQAKGSDTDMSTRNPHRDLAPNNVDFAFTLYKHLVASAPGKNVFISPVSISTALAMLSLGARGYTREQLLQGLGFNLTDSSILCWVTCPFSVLLYSFSKLPRACFSRNNVIGVLVLPPQ